MTTLTELMDSTEMLALAMAAGGELGSPLLAVRLNAGEIKIGPLPDMPGYLTAELVRAVLRAVRPTAAVLVNEAWATMLDPKHNPEHRPWARKLGRGGFGVRDLPEHLRKDIIILTGETNEGQLDDRYFDIHAPQLGSGRRTFTRTDMSELSNMANRFRPLFPSDDGRDRQGIHIPWSESEKVRQHLRDAAGGQE